VRTLLCLLAVAAAATASAPPTTVLRSEDQVDYLLLLAGRPVTVRLHLRSGDKPYRAAMDDWTAKLFKWFDHDGDGYLSKAEAARLIPADWLNALASGAIRGDRPASVPFSSLDTDKDGKVSLAELRAYLRRGMPALTLVADTTRADNAARVNDAIWRHLRADKDGKLSSADLGRLPAVLAKLDENEDELLSEAELLQEGVDIYGIGARPGVDRMGRRPRMLVSLTDMQPAQVAALLVAEYGRGKDGKVTRAEIGLDEGEFAALDLSRDGKLDARELERLVLREPDLTFRGRVGELPGAAGFIDGLGLAARMGLRTQRLALLTPSRGVAKGVRRISPDSVKLLRDKTDVEISATGGQRVNRFSGIGNFYTQQFDQANPDKLKALTREQAAMNQYLAGLFSAADKNGDGMLERKELAAFVALAGEAGTASVTVTVDDSGRNLFGLLDGNGDGVLSAREARTAWSRVAPLLKGGKMLAREDLPRRVALRISEGDGMANGRFARPTGFGQPATARFNGAAPGWFRKMDRNNDGDISPSEWLGTDEEFKRLDADGDGLISAAEAMKAPPKK